MQVEAKFDLELIWYRGDSVRYFAVRVTAPKEGGRKLPAPLNLALVVDASGSMSGDPLRFAIEASQRVVGNLTATRSVIRSVVRLKRRRAPPRLSGHWPAQGK